MDNILLSVSPKHRLSNMLPLCLLGFLGLFSGNPATAAALLDATSLPGADRAALAEQTELLEAIRTSIALSLAECEDENGCELVQDKELLILGSIIDEQREHLQGKQGGTAKDVLTRYGKLQEAYARYRPELRDINLGIKQLTEEEKAKLKEEMDKLLAVLEGYEIGLPEKDEDSVLEPLHAEPEVTGTVADEGEAEGTDLQEAPPASPEAPSVQ